MKIVSFSDIHGYFSVFKKTSDFLKDADVVILAGDITDFGTKKDIETAIRSLKSLFEGQIFGVLGNCDYPSCESSLDSFRINLHNNVVKYGGYQFAGIGGSLVTPFSTPNEYEEDEYEYFLDNIASKLEPGIPLIFVAHQPPFDSECDILSSGIKSGSRSVRAFIEKYQPDVCFSGHVHESVAISYIGDTAVINPGPVRKGRAGVFMESEKGAKEKFIEKIFGLFWTR